MTNAIDLLRNTTFFQSNHSADATNPNAEFTEVLNNVETVEDGSTTITDRFQVLANELIEVGPEATEIADPELASEVEEGESDVAQDDFAELPEEESLDLAAEDASGEADTSGDTNDGGEELPDMSNVDGDTDTETAPEVDPEVEGDADPEVEPEVEPETAEEEGSEVVFRSLEEIAEFEPSDREFSPAGNNLDPENTLGPEDGGTVMLNGEMVMGNHDAENDESQAAPIYPDVGRFLTGPSGQMRLNELAGHIEPLGGANGLLDEFALEDAFQISSLAADAIIANNGGPIHVDQIMTAMSERHTEGFRFMIPDSGIDQALLDLMGGDVLGNLSTFGEEGRIDEEGFTNLAQEALRMAGERPTLRQLSQLFELIAGDRFLDVGEAMEAWPNSVAENGNFSLGSLGQELSVQLANLPRTSEPSPPERRPEPSGMRPYSAGIHGVASRLWDSLAGNSSLSRSEYASLADTASRLTGAFLHPATIHSAYNNKQWRDGDPGIGQREFVSAFGWDPSPWDVVNGVNRSASSWSSSWNQSITLPTWSSWNNGWGQSWRNDSWGQHGTRGW